MTTLFISDLHLDSSLPETDKIFLRFLQGPVMQAEKLYILGDLFEAWIGDDNNSGYNAKIIDALKTASEHCKIYFQHGNRDFLIGERFAKNTGLTLLPESHVIDLYGEPTLLLHGDTLCTDDTAYMKSRQILRSRDFQQKVLSKPLWMRRLLASWYRYRSKRRQRRTPSLDNDIFDVNHAEMVRIMSQHGVKQLIHGHTHRPAIHRFQANGQWYQRIVLSDWHQHGNVLICHADELYLTYFD